VCSSDLFVDRLVPGDHVARPPVDQMAQAAARRRRRDHEIRLLFESLDHERIYFLFLDAEGRSIGRLHFDGHVETASFDLALVLRCALLREAAALLIAHNHPGGASDPSQADILATRRIIEATRLVGIACLDHLIVACGQVFSMRDAGLM
jgi:DNA repair protein RadC